MKKVIAYKGFNKDWTCRGFQYEVGKTYTQEGEVELCKNGFHSCLYPLDVFKYYPPHTSRYALVEVSSDVVEGRGDTKIASSSLTVGQELDPHELAQHAVEWIVSHSNKSTEESNLQGVAINTGSGSVSTSIKCWSVTINTGTRSLATNAGIWSVATSTGRQSVSTNTGDRSVAANTGEWSVSTNTGDRSVTANTGTRSLATNAGERSVTANTGTRSLATNVGDRSVTVNTGDSSVSTTAGDSSVSTNIGDDSAASVEGRGSVAVVTGVESKAKASKGSVIMLCYRGGNGEILHAKAAIAGKDVKPDTWYKLNENGEFVEIE